MLILKSTEFNFGGNPKMHLVKSLLALGLVLAVLGISTAQKPPWDTPAFSGDAAQIARAAASVPAPEGADAVVLLEEQRYTFQSDGTTRHASRFVYRIVTQRGVEGFDFVSCRWEPWHEERPQMRARVITSDGVAHELDPKTIAERPISSEGGKTISDARVLQAPLPGLGSGAVVETEVIVQEIAPSFDAGRAGYMQFGASIPVQLSRLVLEAPESLPLRYTARLLPQLKIEKKQSSGGVQLTFEQEAIAALEPAEALQPSDAALYPQVQFSTGASWQAVAARYAGIVDRTLDHDDVSALVQKARGQAPRDAVATLTQEMNNTVRYTGVEFSEAAIVPRSPNETLTRKYGDCKDKSALLVAMLRAAGIPAYVALLDTGPGEDLLPELPGFGRFDHAIVYVPGPPETWIDATAEFSRPMELPPMDEGRWSLVARSETTQLVRTPESPSSANRIVETRQVFLSELGPARIEEKTEAWGSLESGYRAYYSGADAKALRERLEAYVKAQYSAEKLTALEQSTAADLSHHFQSRLEAAKAKVANTEPDGATVLIQAGGLFEWLPDELKGNMADADTPAEKEKKRRKNDLVLPQPHVAEWRYHIVPPAGFTASELPEPAKRQLGPALVTEEYSRAPDGSVTGVLRFDTVKRRYTAAEVETFRAGLKEYLSSPATYVHFEQIGFALLRAGRVKEALETFRALAASHPQGEALHHVQMARALVEAGLGEAAREEARHAVVLEPGSAEAHKTLAWVLSRDLLGREFEKGYDRDGAEGAYRKAMELDPDDKTIVGNLAILLEHGPDGARYGPGARMDAAIREYESIKDKLDELQIGDNLLIAMLYAGRFKELKEQLKILPPTELRRTMLLEAIAVADGSKPAVQEARRLAGSGSERSTLLANAAGDLLRLRHYREAADLLQASSEGSPQAAQTAQRAEMFRSIRKHEEVELKKDRPEDAVLQFWVLAFSGTPEQALKLQSPLAREKDEARELKKAKATFAGMRAGLSKSNLPSDVLADIALAQIQVKRDGEDAYGCRVRADIPGVGKGVFYLTKESGEVRLLGLTLGAGEETGNIGRLVLRIIDKDPERARRWLDWAREEAALGGGDDPFVGGAFPRFWTRGQTADAATLRYAAAALATEADNPEESGPILLEGRAAAKDPTELQTFDLALAQLYAKQEKYAELLPVARGLVTAVPASRTAFRFLYIALSGMERYAEVESAADERLRRFPDEVSTLRAYSMAAASRGDFAKSDRILKAMIDSGKAEAGDLNNLAWNQLFEGGDAAEEGAQTAQRGIRLSQTPNPNLLHTLACAYAEAGKTREAQDALLQTMAAMNLDEPNGLIWYIVGRMAEQYGLRDAAASAYRKVEKPESRLGLPLSTFALAQKRLKALGVTSAASPSAGPLAGRPTLPRYQSDKQELNLIDIFSWNADSDRDDPGR